MGDSKYIDVTFDLDNDTIEWLTNEAKRTNITIDELVNKILAEELEKLDKKENTNVLS